MLQIGKDETLVSLDFIERFFCCDLEKCLGQCCIDGDAGAPVTEEEEARLREILPEIWSDLLPAAQRRIKEEGVTYRDVEHELVTQILPDSGNCVFSTYAEGGLCICAIEKAFREGRISFRKPISCYLYPARIKQFANGTTAVNYDRWKICKCAEVLGRTRGIRAYQFLRDPFVARFGREWYDELAFTAEEYLRQYGTEDDGHPNEIES